MLVTLLHKNVHWSNLILNSKTDYP